MIALDTETTGLGLRTGDRPFLVTTCTDQGEQLTWEWDVDPLTREVLVDPADVREIGEHLFASGPHGPIGDHEADGGLVMQNSKFDATALERIGLWDGWDVDEAWAAVHDTVVAGHCLKSVGPLNLTDMALEYLGVRIDRYEKELEEAVKDCRRHVQQARLRRKRGKATPGLFDPEDALADWAIADEWQADYWLPRAYAKFMGLPAEHPYWSVTRRYADKDSETTVALWMVQRDLLRRRGLYPHYLERRKLLRATYLMERGGVTYSRARMDEQFPRYTARSKRLGAELVSQAAGDRYDLELPGNGVNNSLRGYCFGPLGLPQYRSAKAKTDAPSLDKNVMARYFEELEGEQLRFVKNLLGKRKADTALAYMQVYKELASRAGDVCTLFPSINVTGTAVTRMSSERPNEQQISAKEQDVDDEDDPLRNLRYLFGPPPGYEWWRMDYENIELRIPAYRFNEPSMVELFEKPDEPPYWGSYHLLNASIVFPEAFWPLAEEKGAFKDRCADLYKRTKNGGFCKQYGGQRRKTDATFGRVGAYDLLESNLTRVAAGNAEAVRFANRYGYIETLPDKTVDPNRGYPVVCSRHGGHVSPTEPFSYLIQGTAGWCGNKALVRCTDQLDAWRARDGFDGRVVFYIHDELVFQLPVGGRKNLPKVRRLQSLMAESGDDVGIPLKVSVSYHPNNWAEEAKW